jgi:hypothetical protein
MPTIPYHATNFPPVTGVIAGSHTFQVTWAELVWAAISVGRAELLHIVRHGEFSIFEMAYRTAILFANLKEDDFGMLRRSSAYKGLDPSEKGAISYFLGMTLAKLSAERLLNVPWLMHLDVYREILQPVLLGGGRPDLVGQDGNGEWVVIESKGRTNGRDEAALRKAKEQASELALIGVQAPRLHVGSVTHFANGILQIDLDDPEVSQRRRIEISLSPENLREGYYRPFIKLLEEDEDGEIELVGNDRFRTMFLSSVDAHVGLSEKMFVPDVLQAGVPFNAPVRDEALYRGRDGILVNLGELWSSENMRREPQERTR